MGQEDTVITFDRAIYVKAKQIQWKFPNKFSDVVIRMGTFHIVFNFLAIIGKKFLNSGLEDLLIESGVYAAGTTSSLMKRNSYNRGVRAHKLCVETSFRLIWLEFVRWYNTSSREQSRHLNEEELQARIARRYFNRHPGLQLNHEEADTRLLLHPKHAADNASRIVIQSPDTDVLVICTSPFNSLSCEGLWFQTGVKDQLRFIPVHKVAPALREGMCNALPAFCALAGCDSNSSLA